MTTQAAQSTQTDSHLDEDGFLDIDSILTPPSASFLATVTLTRTSEDVARAVLPDGRKARMPVTEFYPNRTWDETTSYHCAVIEDKPLLLSTNRPELIPLLLEGLSPEIRNGTVRVVNTARRVGIRSKIAVATTSPDVDPVGVTLGRSAFRVRQLSNMLLGERIDVVAYHQDPVQFVLNALAVRPISAKQTSDETVEVVVPSYQLEAAKGGGNLNISLASRLTGYHIALSSQ